MRETVPLPKNGSRPTRKMSLIQAERRLKDERAFYQRLLQNCDFHNVLLLECQGAPWRSLCSEPYRLYPVQPNSQPPETMKRSQGTTMFSSGWPLVGWALVRWPLPLFVLWWWWGGFCPRWPQWWGKWRWCTIKDNVATTMRWALPRMTSWQNCCNISSRRQLSKDACNHILKSKDLFMDLHLKMVRSKLDHFCEVTEQPTNKQTILSMCHIFCMSLP